VVVVVVVVDRTETEEEIAGSKFSRHFISGGEAFHSGWPLLFHSLPFKPLKIHHVVSDVVTPHTYQRASPIFDSPVQKKSYYLFARLP